MGEQSLHETTIPVASMPHLRLWHLKKNNSRGFYATSSTAASTEHCQPRHLRNIVNRGTYETTTAALSTQHCRSRHLRNIFCRGSYATCTTQQKMGNKNWPRIGRAPMQNCRGRHLRNIISHGIYATSSAVAPTEQQRPQNLRDIVGRGIYITSFSTASTQHALRNKNWAGKIGLELAAARIVGLGNRLSILKFVLVARYNDTIKSKMNFLSIINLSFFLIHVHIKYRRSIFL